MDEKVAKKLSRQLRILNTLLLSFTLVFLAGAIIIGVAAYKVIHELQDAKNNITSLQEKAQQNLDLKTKLCDSDGSVASLLQAQTKVCE